jgi:phosphoglucomutase
MMKIYEKYGFYREGIHTITLKGIDGAEQIKGIMEKIRTNPPEVFGDLKVNKFVDYEKGPDVTGLPLSDVLYFDLDNNSWCCVRPSGTEPKIKFYMGVKGSSLDDSNTKLEALKEAVTALA